METWVLSVLALASIFPLSALPMVVAFLFWWPFKSEIQLFRFAFLSLVIVYSMVGMLGVLLSGLYVVCGLFCAQLEFEGYFRFASFLFAIEEVGSVFYVALALISIFVAPAALLLWKNSLGARFYRKTDQAT